MDKFTEWAWAQPQLTTREKAVLMWLAHYANEDYIVDLYSACVKIDEIYASEQGINKCLNRLRDFDLITIQRSKMTGKRATYRGIPRSTIHRITLKYPEYKGPAIPLETMRARQNACKQETKKAV